MNIDSESDDELVLDTEAEDISFADEVQNEDGEDVLIAFSDDEQEEETPLVKKLRDQLRERDRKLAQFRRSPAINDDDPEPELMARPRSIVDYEYDEDRFNAALDEYEASKDNHAAWKQRQESREASRKSAQDEQAKRVEQQKNALGIKDYDSRADSVREILTDAQLAILINGADNPAQMIAALGAPGAQTRLALLAGEDNLARFAVMVGKMEKEIKVTKRTAPAPESMVRGATAQLSSGPDKHLERLEREAEKTGDRRKVQAYKRQMKQRAA